MGGAIVQKAERQNNLDFGENHASELILDAYKSLGYGQRFYKPLRNFHQLMRAQAVWSMQRWQVLPKPGGWHQEVLSKPLIGIIVLREIRLAAPVRENKRMAGQVIDHP